MKNLLLVLIPLLLAGCVTMIRGTSESLSVTSDPEGALAKLSSGQSCITPCEIELKRNESLIIDYTKEGCEKKSLNVYPPQNQGSVFLSGVGGGLIGGLIDSSGGASFTLQPNPAHVILKC